MDYAFVPGQSKAEKYAQTFFKRRPNTFLYIKKVISNKIPVRVDEFVDYLNTDAGIVKPLEKIIIACHGNDRGQMLITFANGFPSVTKYENLETAYTSKVNFLDASLIDPNTQINIKGCKIGQAHAHPFVGKLKSYFGGMVSLTAPKHYDFFGKILNVGYVEFMAYDFTVVLLTAFTGKTARANLISAFQNEHYTFKDGVTNVPDTQWTNWLPKNIGKGKRTVKFKVNFSPSLKKNNGSNFAKHTLPMSQSFRAVTDKFTTTITYLSSPPTTTSAQETALKTLLQSQPLFQTSHPYPMWQRYELNDFNEFFTGFKWKYKVSKDKKTGNWTLICTATRFIYSILAPITDDPLGANNLLLNISPDTGNTSPATPLILETDNQLFLTV